MFISKIYTNFLLIILIALNILNSWNPRSLVKVINIFKKGRFELKFACASNLLMRLAKSYFYVNFNRPLIIYFFIGIICL